MDQYHLPVSAIIQLSGGTEQGLNEIGGKAQSLWPPPRHYRKIHWAQDSRITFENRRDSLATTDAHCHKRTLASNPLEFMQGLDC